MMERVALSAGRCGSECVEYSTKALTLKNTNLWRLSRLVKNYGVTIVESNDSNKIYFLSNYDDNDFAFAFEELKKENTK